MQTEADMRRQFCFMIHEVEFGTNTLAFDGVRKV